MFVYISIKNNTFIIIHSHVLLRHGESVEQNHVNKISFKSSIKYYGSS